MNGIKQMTQKVYAGGFLYNFQTNSVLLHKRDSKTKINPNLWGFFGGLSEDVETPRVAFVRELKEELNITVHVDDLIPLCDYMNEELHIYRYTFYVESSLKKTEMRLGEGEDFDWIPINKVFGYDLTKYTKRDLKLFIERRGV